MQYAEAKKAAGGVKRADFYREFLEQSKSFRVDYRNRRNIVKSEDMPWDDSVQGRIKHMVNEKMNTRECAIDLYQQFLAPGGASGRHRHMSEEILYVLEGRGYDLHWDVKFECAETYRWDWEKEPKKFDWEEGDYVYIPPYTTHQHFNADGAKTARFISATNRIVKALGFDWLEQVEPAPDYKSEF